MRPKLAQREWGLAAVALLAVAVALAIVAQTHDAKGAEPTPEGSFTALAGSSGPEAFGRRTACGGVLRPETEGVSHPTLPCGARVFITYHGLRVLTQVVDRGPYEPGRQFDVTDALARRLGLRGVQVIHWAYARTG
jgi:rare lipoprotein A